ncbi:hypothetical protein BRO15_04155, partial [Xanthomonas oryzae pv. oryzae]
MLRLSALLLARSCVFSASAFAVTPVAAPEVRTDHGAVRGQWQDEGSAVFRAVLFAAPPLGALRWRPRSRLR